MRSWLRKKRESAGLTMKQLSEKLGISESYYCAIENGERQKKMDVVLVSGISCALNIPISQIVEWESQKAPVNKS